MCDSPEFTMPKNKGLVMGKKPGVKGLSISVNTMNLDEVSSDDEQPGSPGFSFSMSTVSKMARESVARRASVVPGKVPLSPRRSPRASPKGTPMRISTKLASIEETKNPGDNGDDLMIFEDNEDSDEGANEVFTV